MKARTAVLLTLWFVLVAAAAASAGTQMTAEEQRSLRARVETDYDVLPLSDGIALRPKTPRRDVRLIEIAADTIAVNGAPVTGRELRDQLGADADLVLRLSFMSLEERLAMFEFGRESSRRAPEEEADSAPQRTEPERLVRERRARGDRVRIFGNVAVERDEEVRGQAVAVFGSARIDGEVGDQVVAVFGSVDLGPDAVVGGDVISVGGRVRRQPGSQVRGGTTEISLAGSGVNVEVAPWLAGWGPVHFFGPWGAVPRLVGSVFHFLLLALLASVALLLARTTVERAAERVSNEPLKMTLVGIVAQLLAIPALVLTAILLAISLIGIPLLLLLPFVVLFLLLMALAGFTGTAYAIGEAARRRFNLSNSGAFVAVVLGVFVVLLPILLGRLLAVAGWPIGAFAILLVAAGVGIEFLAWASGFGAVLTNAFTRWQARRASRTVVTTPPPAAPPPVAPPPASDAL